MQNRNLTHCKSIKIRKSDPCWQSESRDIDRLRLWVFFAYNVVKM